MDIKINCNYIKHIAKSEKFIKDINYIINTTTTYTGKEFNHISLNTSSSSEVHENNVLAENVIKDLRTYICAHGKCLMHNNRSHKRLSHYNWKKMQSKCININLITRTANEIINIMIEDTKLNKNKQTAGTTYQTTVVNCVYCCNPKLKYLKHIHYRKDNKATNCKNDNTLITQEKNIEEIFSQIDKKAEMNTHKILSKPSPNPPGNKLESKNNYRMTYGDINYLGNNKALLYFDRGIRGTQTFTNSMQPISKQPKYKDLIVLDGIVFTSSCKCDSALQHREMFPHYRVTCAVGLTCPARLDNFEKEIFKRSRNASTEMYTKASSMLIRYW